MNAGKDWRKAQKQAQANADSSGHIRYLHIYGGAYWIDATEPAGSYEAFTPHGKAVCEHGSDPARCQKCK